MIMMPVIPRAGVVSIEASDPVAYVASQPDAKTFVIELPTAPSTHGEA